MRTTTVTIGENRGRPRIYLQGKWLREFGFDPGTRYTASQGPDSLHLHLHPDGKYTVSSKKKNTVSVIDIHRNELDTIFNTTDELQVQATTHSIVLSYPYVHKLLLLRQLTPTTLGIFAGGGLLDQAAKNAGFKTLAAVESNEKYADIWKRNHTGDMYNLPIEAVNPAEFQRYQPVGLVTMGLPCQPFSRIRISGNTYSEEHELGDMFVWALRMVEAINPHTIIIENVPGFLDSVAGIISERVLQKFGYIVESRVLNSQDYGSITSRSRSIIVASMYPEIHWPEPQSQPTMLGSILHDPDDPRCEWFTPETKSWLYNHWERQTAKGNGFQPPVLTESDKSVPTIKKRYFAQQGDNPVVGHPTKPNTHRWFTLDEVKQIMGLPQSYDLGETKTYAGEVLGQGVSVELFTKVIRSVTRT